MLSPLLTICIPSYNRAGYLDTLLTFLKANLLNEAAYDIELIVVNNNSTDATAAVLEKHAHPHLRAIQVEHHRPTAEENIIRSVEFCRGEYVWFLGDDDVPVLENFASHYRLLQKGDADFFLFNASITDSKGNLSVLQNIKMNRPMLETSMPSLVMTIGCLFTLAGVSNQIIRRSLLSTERGLHYMGISQIYSMVAWIIEAAKDARVIFVNAPLVYYRENDYGNHWSGVAKKMGVCDRYFWSIGLVDLFSELIKNKCLTYAQVARIVEVKRDGARFSSLDDIISMFYTQIVYGAADANDTRQIYTDAQMERAVTFFKAVDATSHDLVMALKELHSLAAEGKSIKDAHAHYMTIYQGRQTVGLRARQVERVCYGYEIIRTELGYVAVRENMQNLREEALKVVDPLPCEPYVLVEEKWDVLLTKMQAHAIKNAEARAAEMIIVGAERLEMQENFNRTLKELHSIYSSTCWKLTYPYRAAGTVVKGIMSQGHSLKQNIHTALSRRRAV
jgi:glycosyltransferase involved in cell wall biosynthesis